MKVSFLIIGIVLFFMGAVTRLKIFLAAGIICLIISFFGKKPKDKSREDKKIIKEEKKTKGKFKCKHCGAELISDDNYCPGCGKKILP